MKKKLHLISIEIRHFFHVVSNVRPIWWICLYVALMPVFALIYSFLPPNQFRIPDGAATDYGSWLYYSIVTITTLGFGDYTPAHAWAQGVTAVEVMCGLVILGFFLNAVGSMKSEIDVASEIEKQKALHRAQAKEQLVKNAPLVFNTLNRFLSFCYALTTPLDKQNGGNDTYNPDFTEADMRDMYKPSGLPDDHSGLPTIEIFLRCASKTSLFLDSLQNRIDLAIWPDLLEDCFSFVADYQMFFSTDTLAARFAGTNGDAAPVNDQPDPALAEYVRKNAQIALNIEAELTRIVNESES